jgi:hypothetical protein
MCLICVNEKSREDLSPQVKKANRRARHERLRSLPISSNPWLQGVNNGVLQQKNRPKVIRK